MIYLLWSTIRERQLLDNYKIWSGFAKYPKNLKLKVAVDTIEAKNYLLNDGIEDVIVVDNPRNGVVAPLNALCQDLNEYNKFDLIVVPSDDFVPFVDWDEYLLKKYETFTGLFKVNDGQMKNIISMPVLDGDTFDYLGKMIYNKAYNHMFCDQELHDIVHELGMCKHASYSDPIFTHKHYTFGSRTKDDFDVRNMLSFQSSKMIYQERRKLSLHERIK